MMPISDDHRLYIFGASGSGTTTLGQEMARHLGVVHVDSDDHYWAPMDPPFSVKRDPPARVASMSAALGKNGWVLTGACHGWGHALTDHADLIVFVTLPTAIRIQRLIIREKARFGDRIQEGGDMHRIHQGFIRWARGYDNPDFEGRNRAAHEEWLSARKTPICRIEGDQSLADAQRQVLERLRALS